MKNTIRLDIIHSERERVEYFLNSVQENLEQIPFDDQELRGLDDVIQGFKFKVIGRPAFVIVIFATSYFHANEIQSANVPLRPDIKWTINGPILFGVGAADENTSSEMLSFFAGRE